MTTGTVPASAIARTADCVSGPATPLIALSGLATMAASACGSSRRRRISMALVSISLAVIGFGSLVSAGCTTADTGSVAISVAASVAGPVARSVPRSVVGASSGPEGEARSDPAATSSFVSLVASSSTSMSSISGAGPIPWAAISIAAAGSASAFGWPEVLEAGLPSTIRAAPSVVSVFSEGAWIIAKSWANSARVSASAPSFTSPPSPCGAIEAPLVSAFIKLMPKFQSCQMR